MRSSIILVCIFYIVVGCNPNKIRHRPVEVVNANVSLNSEENSMQKTVSFYDLTLKTLDNTTLNMADFKGKKVVILNVASECGYTPQYSDWEKFYKSNKEKVVVIGIPCNQFGGQESGSHEEIKSFCQKNYGVTFPIAEKMDVKGSNKSPLYQWLTDKSKNGWNEQEPTWNFCKYLINEKGELIDFYASAIKPDNADFKKEMGY